MCLNEEITQGLFPEVDPKMLSGLSLAFIGDAVYELVIRNYILSKGESRVGSLHKDTVRLVNADFQAEMSELLIPLLSEDEIAVFKRGRNAHPGHIPKNKTGASYHKATGFEALIGYLYLRNDKKRLNEILSHILSRGEENAE